MFPLDGARKPQTIYLSRHHDITKDEINAVALELFKCSFCVRDPANRVAKLLEQAGARGCYIGIIFDQQHGAAGHRAYFFFCPRSSRLPSRQADGERRAFSQFARHRDCAPGLMGETMHLRKPETCAFASRLGGEEWVEYVAHDIGRNT